MKSMKNFAAQQLSKKQMNDVKGGQMFLCKISSDGGKTWMEGLVEANSADHAGSLVALTYYSIAEETGVEYDIICTPR